jgi:hypothetical protein
MILLKCIPGARPASRNRQSSIANRQCSERQTSGCCGTRRGLLPLLPSGPGGVHKHPSHSARSLTYGLSQPFCTWNGSTAVRTSPICDCPGSVPVRARASPDEWVRLACAWLGLAALGKLGFAHLKVGFAWASFWVCSGEFGFVFGAFTPDFGLFRRITY